MLVPILKMYSGVLDNVISVAAATKQYTVRAIVSKNKQGMNWSSALPKALPHENEMRSDTTPL